MLLVLMLIPFPFGLEFLIAMRTTRLAVVVILYVSIQIRNTLEGPLARLALLWIPFAVLVLKVLPRPIRQLAG